MVAARRAIEVAVAAHAQFVDRVLVRRKRVEGREIARRRIHPHDALFEEPGEEPVEAAVRRLDEVGIREERRAIRPHDERRAHRSRELESEQLASIAALESGGAHPVEISVGTQGEGSAEVTSDRTVDRREVAGRRDPKQRREDGKGPGGAAGRRRAKIVGRHPVEVPVARERDSVGGRCSVGASGERVQRREGARRRDSEHGSRRMRSTAPGRSEEVAPGDGQGRWVPAVGAREAVNGGRAAGGHVYGIHRAATGCSAHRRRAPEAPVGPGDEARLRDVPDVPVGSEGVQELERSGGVDAEERAEQAQGAARRRPVELSVGPFDELGGIFSLGRPEFVKQRQVPGGVEREDRSGVGGASAVRRSIVAAVGAQDDPAQRHPAIRTGERMELFERESADSIGRQLVEGPPDEVPPAVGGAPDEPAIGQSQQAPGRGPALVRRDAAEGFIRPTLRESGGGRPPATRGSRKREISNASPVTSERRR